MRAASGGALVETAAAWASLMAAGAFLWSRSELLSGELGTDRWVLVQSGAALSAVASA